MKKKDIEIKDGIKTFHARYRKSWRSWLSRNGEKERSVWLIIYKKLSSITSIDYVAAVEEAICFGWIDSKANKRDENSFYLFFAQRNPKSNWSKVNKIRVESLITQGLMTSKGLELIDLAKKNKSWFALDKISELKLPQDLKKRLAENTIAGKHFKAFPPSAKKGILEWIQNAKRPETRNKRIEETIQLAEKNIRANQFTPKNKLPD